MKPKLLAEITAVISIIAILLAVAYGCTSQATKNAIEYYETSQDQQQLSFDNAMMAANQQLFLATSQYVDANANDKKALMVGLKAAFIARQNLETMKMQFQMARSLNRLTVGVYLYDKQGIGNILFEEMSKHLSVVSKATSAAQTSIGKADTDPVLPQSIIDLIHQHSAATSQPALPPTGPTTQRIEELTNDKK
jgi:hypothetical protein